MTITHLKAKYYQVADYIDREFRESGKPWGYYSPDSRFCMLMGAAHRASFNGCPVDLQSFADDAKVAIYSEEV